MGSEGTAPASGWAWLDWVAPALWAVFLWAFVVVASQVASQAFYVAVRGTGIVQYPSTIVVFSPAYDRIAFLVLGGGVLALNSALLRYKGRSDALAVLGSVGLALGLGGFAFASPLFIALAGVSAVTLVIEGSSRVAMRTESGARVPLTMTVVFAAGVLAVVAAISAARWVVGGFDGSTPLGDPSWGFSVVASQVLGLVYPVLPELTLLFFFAWAVRVALASELGSTGWPNDRSEDEFVAVEEPRPWREGPLPLILLLLGIATAVFVGIYPYLPAVNPSSILVGVDVRYCYSYWLQSLPGSHVCGPVGFFIGNERYGALWLLQGLVVATGSVQSALELAPAVWGALLVVSVFLFVREGTGDRLIAGVSGLFTGVSMHVVAGVDAGILANWLGLSTAFLLLTALLRGLRTRRFVYMVPAFALFAALLFIHPWTWAVVLVVLTLYLGVDLLQSGFTRHVSSMKFGLAVVLALLGLGLAVDLFRSTLPSGSGLLVAVNTVLPSLNPAHIPQVASNLEETLVEYLGGAQANPVWFVLGTAGVLAIPSLGVRFGKMLVVWVGAMSIAVLVVAPPINLLQSRMIYDVPIQIFAAIGFVGIIEVIRKGLGGTGPGKEKLASAAAAVMLIAVVGLALGFALDYVGFLYQ